MVSVAIPSSISSMNHSDTLELLSQRFDAVLDRVGDELAERTKSLKRRESEAEKIESLLSKFDNLPVNSVSNVLEE